MTNKPYRPRPNTAPAVVYEILADNKPMTVVQINSAFAFRTPKWGTHSIWEALKYFVKRGVATCEYRMNPASGRMAKFYALAEQK